MKKSCIVKGCGTKAEEQGQLCFKCNVMLSRGLLLPSGAWFAVEMEFLNQQNQCTIEQVRKLHDQVNELMGEE